MGSLLSHNMNRGNPDRVPPGPLRVPGLNPPGIRVPVPPFSLDAQ